MLQIVEQTHDEKVAMYVESCSKKELAEMLANCNEIMDALLPVRVVMVDPITTVGMSANGIG